MTKKQLHEAVAILFKAALHPHTVPEVDVIKAQTTLSESIQFFQEPKPEPKRFFSKNPCGEIYLERWPAKYLAIRVLTDRIVYFWTDLEEWYGWDVFFLSSREKLKWCFNNYFTINTCSFRDKFYEALEQDLRERGL